MTQISYFKSGEFSRVTGEVSLDEYLEHVKEGRWQDKVLAVRNGKADKTSAPSVTVSGLFQDRRRRENLVLHSGIMGIDLDQDDNDDLAAVRPRLEQDPHCYACHTSIRGFGLVWYVKVSPDKHLEAFQAIERYLANEYGVVVDPSGKDVSRLRFISYDPNLYLNRSARKWSKYLTKAQREPQAAPRIAAYHDEDIRHILEQITSRRVNIAEDYHSWLHISFALASEFGEAGRDYFHAVSAVSSKYERAKCDKQYDIALKRDHAGGIGIGTFFHFCKQAGIETITPETREAITIYRQRVKTEPGRSRKEAMASTLEYMEKMGQVAPERVLPVLEKLEEVPDGVLNETRVHDDIIYELEAYIKQRPLAYNEVTRYLEMDGVQMEDRDYNGFYLDARRVLGSKLQKNLVFDMINSPVVPSYHPFLDFIEQNKHLKPKGRLAELLSCFDYEKPANEEEPCPYDQDYLEVFMTRWLLGIISSMNGTFSLLTLVLIGPQGSGKSNFFRHLLPDELQRYSTENKLDLSSKDVEMLMAKMLLICDDEFSGKNKKDAAWFKEMSSKQKFSLRTPYGKVIEDHHRYAVLCGTSNIEQVLNDLTGNRRIIPVNLRKIDLERYLAIDKTELFMELYWMWREVGDGWMLGEQEREYLRWATKENVETQIEVDLVLKYFEPATSTGVNCTPMTTTEIMVYLEERTRRFLNLNKLGQALKASDFIKKTVRRGSTRATMWLVIQRYRSREEEQNGPADTIELDEKGMPIPEKRQPDF